MVKSVKLSNAHIFSIVIKLFVHCTFVLHMRELFDKNLEIPKQPTSSTTTAATKLNIIIPALFSLSVNTHTHSHTQRMFSQSSIVVCIFFLSSGVYYFVLLLLLLLYWSHFVDVCFVRACMCHENSNEMEWFLFVRFYFVFTQIDKAPENFRSSCN